MSKFIKVCQTTLGGNYTQIYSYLNVDHIVRIELNFTTECNVRVPEPTVFLADGSRFLIVYRSDLISLVGESVVKEFDNVLHES